MIDLDPADSVAARSQEMTEEIPIACTLSTAERSTRLTTARELGRRALVGLDVSDRRALLRFHGEQAGVAALVRAESGCCEFFEFATTPKGEETELEIRTPEGGEPLLRGLLAGIVAGWQGGLR
jgi:hypothetical protein